MLNLIVILVFSHLPIKIHHKKHYKMEEISKFSKINSFNQRINSQITINNNSNNCNSLKVRPMIKNSISHLKKLRMQIKSLKRIKIAVRKQNNFFN